VNPASASFTGVKGERGLEERNRDLRDHRHRQRQPDPTGEVEPDGSGTLRGRRDHRLFEPAQSEERLWT